jgi:ech hydrogenase subunit E
MRTEQPRGEVVYCLKAGGAKNLQRFRVRTPTFANLPAMLQLAARLRSGRRSRPRPDH